LDQDSVLGYATTRYEERSLAALGFLSNVSIIHQAHQGLCGGGILFLLPALLAQGLLTSKDLYSYNQRSYYPFESILLTLAFMILGRIKNPEQLKNCKQGELGRLLGLDRIPETKCLREKINLLANQEKGWEWNKVLIQHWYPADQSNEEEDGLFYYIDGHVRIYHGYMATLPLKYVSRQKLCLSATTEYWVNDKEGMPVLMVMGELTEKLQNAIEDNILPKLIEAGHIKTLDQSKLPATPQCTFVFDREAYALAFFERLWNTYRIAILTYRKNVKDKWDELAFKSIDVQLLNNKTMMLLCEQPTTLGNLTYREVRRLGNNTHQTSIITTHPTLLIQKIAANMFDRWTQENFFRYMIADFDFDKIIEFGTEEIDLEKQIVNPDYKAIAHKLKKLREKISRKKAAFYGIAKDIMDQSLDHTPKLTEQEARKHEEIQTMKSQEALLMQQRKICPYKIKLKQMPPTTRLNKLKSESKLLMNVLKMICYRAESSVANILQEKFKRGTYEKRMLVKQIINTPADLLPDLDKKTLTITLHSLSANRFNEAITHLIGILNHSNTIFPGTDLTLIFKSTAM
jgi:hypothetical protein